MLQRSIFILVFMILCIEVNAQTNADIGVSSINIDQNPICDQQTDFEVTVFNNGADSAEMIVVFWTYEELSSPDTHLYLFMDSAIQVGASVDIVIGSFEFMDANTSYKFTAWTGRLGTLSNIDNNNSNDTSTLVVNTGNIEITAPNGTDSFYREVGIQYPDVNNTGYCDNGGDEVIVNGDYPPYFYTWPGGAANIAKLPDAYSNTVTVTDSLGCKHSQLIKGLEVELRTKIDSLSNPTCHGYEDGYISLSKYFPLTFDELVYVWGTDTTQSISGLKGDSSYAVEIYDSTFTCSTTDTFTLKQPDKLNSEVIQVDSNTLKVQDTNNLNYSFFDCGDLDIIQSDTLIQFSPELEGDYGMIIYDGVCRDTSQCYYLIGVEEDEDIENSVNNKSQIEQGFKLYPNPTTGLFRVGLRGLKQSDIQVYNSNGQMLSVTLNGNEIDLSSYSKGMYFVRVGGLTKKLIVK